MATPQQTIEALTILNGSSFADDDIMEIEINTGAGYVTRKLNGAMLRYSLKQRIVIPLSDTTSNLTTGTGVNFLRDQLHKMKIYNVGAYCSTAPTGAAIQVDINLTGTGSILSTPITIDAGEKSSTTAATPPVISTSIIPADGELTFDIDQVGSTVAGVGLYVYIEYKLRKT